MTIDPRVAAINGRQCLTRRRTGRGLARLDDADVRAIRRAWDQGETISALARDYGVARMTVANIVHWDTYTHLDPEIAR